MAIFTILLLVAIFGVFKPFKGIARKYFAIAAFILFIIVVAVSPKPAPPKPLTPAEAAAQKAEAAKAEADKAERDRESVMETQRQHVGRAAKEAIKEAARNPDSVTFSTVAVNEDATLVCVVYRAQNGFGGMNQESVAFKNGSPKQSASFWNKNCAHAELYSQPTNR